MSRWRGKRFENFEQTNKRTNERKTKLHHYGLKGNHQTLKQDNKMVFLSVCVCAGVSVCVFSSDRNRKIQAPVVPQKLAKLKALCC